MLYIIKEEFYCVVSRVSERYLKVFKFYFNLSR
jgi:hypothetical protein